MASLAGSGPRRADAAGQAAAAGAPGALQATYVAQGGCEAVVYRVGDSSVRDGVQAGDWWFPGYDLPGGAPGERFALFGAPFDLDDPERIRLVAEETTSATRPPWPSSIGSTPGRSSPTGS